MLLGEAKEKYFNNKAKNRLKIWKKIRLQNAIKIVPLLSIVL
jgi:hypothetical protein